MPHAQSLRLHRHRCKLAHHAAASPRILNHTRQSKIAGIYGDQPAKILQVETKDSPGVRSRRPCRR